MLITNEHRILIHDVAFWELNATKEQVAADQKLWDARIRGLEFNLQLVTGQYYYFGDMPETFAAFKGELAADFLQGVAYSNRFNGGMPRSRENRITQRLIDADKQGDAVRMHKHFYSPEFRLGVAMHEGQMALNEKRSESVEDILAAANWRGDLCRTDSWTPEEFWQRLQDIEDERPRRSYLRCTNRILTINERLDWAANGKGPYPEVMQHVAEFPEDVEYRDDGVWVLVNMGPGAKLSRICVRDDAFNQVVW